MSLVLADPAGFAVDWDWRHGLSVWALQGPASEARYGERLLDHRLEARPAGLAQARQAARRWWRVDGRSRAAVARGGSGEAAPG